MESEKRDYERVSDKELIQRFCADPPDPEAFGDLWRRHEQTIRKFVGTLGNMCPHFHSRDLFCEEVFSRTQEKVARRICTFQGRAAFSTWLWSIVQTTSVELRRELTGRALVPREFDSPTEADLAKAYAAFQNKLKQDPLHHATKAEMKTIVRAILKRYSKSEGGFESLDVVVLSAVEECSAADIARRRCTYDQKVHRMLAHDYLALQALFAEAGIANIQAILHVPGE